MKYVIALFTLVSSAFAVADGTYLQISSSISFDGRSTVLYDQIDAQDNQDQKRQDNPGRQPQRRQHCV